MLKNFALQLIKAELTRWLTDRALKFPESLRASIKKLSPAITDDMITSIQGLVTDSVITQLNKLKF